MVERLNGQQGRKGDLCPGHMLSSSLLVLLLSGVHYTDFDVS